MPLIALFLNVFLQGHEVKSEADMGSVVTMLKALEDDISGDELIMWMPPGAQLFHFAYQEVFVFVLAESETQPTLCNLV